MATTNPVSQVLVTSGDQAILAAGSRPDALGIGQLGFFNYHTGLSIDGTVAADAKDIFIAVGIDPLGTGSVQDINKSSGQLIQVKNAKAPTFRGYMTALPKIIDIAGFVAKCETSYAIKVELRNGQIYAENGYNQFTKTFAVTTGCCADQCEECGDGDCNEIAEGIVTNVNLDPDGLVTAQYFGMKIVATINGAPTADGNTTVTVGTTEYTVAVLDADTTAIAAQKIVDAINDTANSPYAATLTGSTITIYAKTTTNTNTATFAVSGSGVTANAITGATKTTVAASGFDAFVEAYPGVCLGIRLTSVPVPVNSAFGSINLKYVAGRETDMIVSLVDGFTCNGEVVTVQELRKSEGHGYDVRQLEYLAGGWNGKPGPYRTSDTTGTERGGFQYFTSLTGTYSLFTLVYDQFSVGGWLEYLNNLETVIAIPCADSTTLAGIATVLDLIFTQFGAMANDVSASGDCTNSATSALTPATDGIESVTA
jgi:hypothetical protein